MWFNVIKRKIPKPEYEEYFMSLIQDVTIHIRQLKELPESFDHAFAGSIKGDRLTFGSLADLLSYVDKLREESLRVTEQWDEQSIEELEEHFDAWDDLAVETDAPEDVIESLESFINQVRFIKEEE